MDIAALIVSIASALGSLGAVVYARQSVRAAVRAAVAAERSAVSGEGAATLEAGRRHAELTPRFKVSAARANPGVDGLTPGRGRGPMSLAGLIH